MVFRKPGQLKPGDIGKIRLKQFLRGGVNIMKTTSICVLGLMGIGVFAGPLAADTATDQLMARYGQFVLDNGDTKSLARGQKVKTYRVCMEQSREGAVPLKVAHDGEETIVEPGECHLIKAKKIRIASAGKLDNDTVLVGRWRSSSDARNSQPAVASASRAVSGDATGTIR